MFKRFSLHDAAAWLAYLLPVGLCFSRAAGDVIASSIALLFLVHCSLQRDWRWLREPWVMIALAFWLYAMSIGLFAERPDKAIGRAAAWIRYPIFAAALAYWICHAPHFKQRIIASITGCCVFLIGDSFLQYFTGRDILGREAIPDLNTVRLTGPYSSARVGISLLWLGFAAPVYWFCRSLHPHKDAKRFALATLFLAGFCATLLISGERMSVLLCGLGLFITLLLAPGRLKRYSLIALGVIALGIGALVSANPGLIERHVGETQLLAERMEDNHYMNIWRSAIAIAEEHPLTGVGMRHFREECPKEIYGPLEPPRCNTHPHNRYLEILTETGLLGLACWLAMFAYWMRDGLRSLWLNRGDFFLMGLIALLCIRMWPLASTTSIMISWSAVPFWLVIGLIYAHIRTQTLTKES